MKAIGYCRVSTLEQSDEGISLENQAQKIRQYCQLNELELTSIITDAGLSGKTTNRPGLTELLRLVKTKKVQAVVVYKLDRLSRKVLDTLTMIEMFDKAKIDFHSINEKIDTTSAMGRFFLNITASLAQMERELISERTADALQMKIKNHERAGRVPYGWTLAEDGNSLIANLLEQEAVIRIRELRTKGYSLRAICTELTKEGYKPQGAAWYASTIQSILKRAA